MAAALDDDALQSGAGPTGHLEVEAAALYGLLTDPDTVWPRVEKLFAPDLFHVPELRAAAEVVQRRLQAREQIDVVLVMSELQHAGRYDAAASVGSIVRGFGTTANAEAYFARLVELRDQRTCGGKNHAGPLRGRWVRFSVADLERAPPAKAFIWDGRIPHGDVGALAAAGASGKTSLIVGLGIHRALGVPFLGRGVRQGSTVIVTTEDGRDDYLRKIAAWRSALGDFDLDLVARHLHLVDLTGEPFRLIRSEYGDYQPTTRPDLLADAVRATAPGADLIVLETVSRLGGDEGNAAMSALVCAAERLAVRARASVLLVSHVAKAAAREKNGDAHAPRGGSSISDNGRFTITITGIDDDRAAALLPGVSLSPEMLRDLLVLRVPKINSAPPQEPVVLQRVATPHGLALRLFEAPSALAAEEAALERRRMTGEMLHALARRQTAAGRELTESRLSDGMYREIVGLAKHRVKEAVEQAVTDGFLRREIRKARGGGLRLVPCAGGDREGSRESSSAATGSAAGNKPPAVREEGLGELSLPAARSPLPAPGGGDSRECCSGEFAGSGNEL